MTYDKLDHIMNLVHAWPDLSKEEFPAILAEFVCENYPMKNSDGVSLAFMDDEYCYGDALARCLAIMLDTDVKVADFDKWCRDRIDEIQNPGRRLP